jgi:hypothetical protein
MPFSANRNKKQTYIGLLLPLILVIITLVLAYILLIPAIRNILLERQKAMTKELVHSAYSLVEGYNKMVESKILTIGEAQKLALESIQNLRYGDDNKEYFWVSNEKEEILAHPYYKNYQIKINETEEIEINLSDFSVEELIPKICSKYNSKNSYRTQKY